jgi:hemolysin activation/secretion protein
VSFGTSLLASEQFAVGGALFGRGYDPAELTGDQGFAMKNELQYDFRPDFLTAETPARSPALQLFAFHDFGLVADQHPQLLDQSAATRSLASAGFGVRATWLQYTANLELGKPLTRDVAAFADNPDPKPFRLYFVLTAHF